MKTVKLYDENAYLSEFYATVLSSEERNGKFYTVLDKTAFFPTSAGQTGDSGFIGDAFIAETVTDEKEIYHISETELKVGKEYPCRLDFEKRFDKMQNHSGEHIISGIVHNLFGFDNTGFHLSDNIVTLDFNGCLSPADLKEIELEANRKVQQNLKITAYYPKAEELPNIDYRSKLDLTENVRIVEIENTDKCACCAPHVKNTGEIGVIKICSIEKHKNGIRLSIKCGMRAVNDYAEKANSVSEISALLCAKHDEITDAVKTLKQNLADALFSLTESKRENIKKIIENIKSDKSICVFLENASADDMRFAANLLKEKCSIGGVFSKTQNGFNYVCTTAFDTDSFKNALNSELDGSGGGRNGMITGSVKTEKNKIEEFFKDYIDNFSK